MPIDGAWVQQGWQEQGTARVILARAQPSGAILLGEYVVDCLCAGVKSSTYAVNVSPDVFQNEAIPRIYGGEPPMAISEELAHEIIWGAVEYAEGLGLRAHASFRESQRILEPADALPRSAGVRFGYEGRPAYIPAPTDNELAILRSLIDSVGIGNFHYAPRGEVSDEIAELLGAESQEQEDDSERSAIWTPEQMEEMPGSVSADSGLWVPGQMEEPSESADRAEPAGIWTPGRS